MPNVIWKISSYMLNITSFPQDNPDSGTSHFSLSARLLHLFIEHILCAKKSLCSHGTYILVENTNNETNKCRTWHVFLGKVEEGNSVCMCVGWGRVFCSLWVIREDDNWLEGVNEPWRFLEEHSKLREQQVQCPLTCSETKRCVAGPIGTWEQRRSNVIREVQRPNPVGPSG